MLSVLPSSNIFTPISAYLLLFCISTTELFAIINQFNLGSII
jgi:hypothetical protein